MNTFKIKALSPDNGAAIRGLVRLFTHVYGASFPVAGVYREDFWRAQLGKRFISIVAEDKGDIVAHLAIYREEAETCDAIAALPVTDPAYRHAAGELFAAAQQMVRRLSRAQGWRSVVSFVYEGVGSMQSIPQSITGSREVAILPGYLPDTPVRARGERIARATLVHGRGTRRHALVTMRAVNPLNEPHRRLFVPERHQEICRLLYAPLGLSRSFSGPDRSARSTAPSRSAVERVYLRGLGSHHVFAAPSAVSDVRALEPRGIDGQKALFVYLDLTDARCPSLCAELENQGYRFCGVLPLYRGQDSIIYFKETDNYSDRRPFRTARATMLSQYIERYDISRALDVLIPDDRISHVSERTGRPAPALEARA